MKQNLILIHSYNGDTADSFADSLKLFCEKIGLSYCFPIFPIRKDASYESWKCVMDRQLINSDTIIVAHSLGTNFIVRYLAEKQLPIQMYAGVAGYLHYEGRKDLEEILSDFTPSEEEFSLCHELIRYRYAFFSDNDRMNPKEKLIDYAEHLDAEKICIHDAGHFDPSSGVKRIEILEQFIKDHLEAL